MLSLLGYLLDVAVSAAAVLPAPQASHFEGLTTMSKAEYGSHGWVVMSYERVEADKNWRVSIGRDGVYREIRTYDHKPPVVGDVISINKE